MTLSDRKKRLLEIIGRFHKARVLVVGDVMADHYVWGEVERISPEAPVPVVRVIREEVLLGGAANVADNLKALGAEALLLGIVGQDESAEQLRDILAAKQIDSSTLLGLADRPTIVKTRVIAHHQQVVRVDRERDEPLKIKNRQKLLDVLTDRAPKLDAVIVSDYGKSVIDKTLLDHLRRLSRKHGVTVAVDPKIRNMPYYRGFSTMTPNHHETGQALGIKLINRSEDVHRAGLRLRKKLHLESLVITRGEEGMSLFFGENEVIDIPTVAREVYDVTGAGDTVIAALTCGLAVGAGLHEAAQIANHAAGLVIAEIGTASAAAAAVARAIRGARELP